MDLLTQEILDKFQEIGSQENISDPIVIVKYFYWSWTWFATEYDTKYKVFFWYVIGQEKEFWYFSIKELESFRWNFWLAIERDLYFKPQPLSQLVEVSYS